jgi:probable rRNA maturation factor
MSQLTVVVQVATSATALPSSDQISDWVQTAVDGECQGELTVRVVDEAESANLNARYRNRNGPTNVLAFQAEADWPVNADDIPPIGDVVICAPVVQREAVEQGKAAEAHWAHLVVHGALHLLGFDHESPAEAGRMEAREREALARLGYADPYV